MQHIVVVYGTRPEIIRLSRIIPVLKKCYKLTLVNTGQNFDPRLNAIFEREFDIRSDIYLDIGNKDKFTFISELFKTFPAVIQKENPDAILILGDTYSGLSALISKMLMIPIIHLEAGNRCHLKEVPEEINRLLIDVISDFNLCYSDYAKQNLEKHSPKDNRFVIGSPLAEVYESYKTQIETSPILKELGLKKNKYIVVSIHRNELVECSDASTILNDLFAYLETSRLNVVVSIHPRLGELIDTDAYPGIMFSNPFGFFDYASLLKNCYTAISDSGSLAEEGSIIGKRFILFREVSERQEAIEQAGILISGFSSVNVKRFLESFNFLDPIEPIDDYKRVDCSQRVLSLVSFFFAERSRSV